MAFMKWVSPAEDFLCVTSMINIHHRIMTKSPVRLIHESARNFSIFLLRRHRSKDYKPEYNRHCKLVLLVFALKPWLKMHLMSVLVSQPCGLVTSHFPQTRRIPMRPRKLRVLSVTVCSSRWACSRDTWEDVMTSLVNQMICFVHLGMHGMIDLFVIIVFIHLLIFNGCVIISTKGYILTSILHRSRLRHSLPEPTCGCISATSQFLVCSSIMHWWLNLHSIAHSAIVRLHPGQFPNITQTSARNLSNLRGGRHER